MNTIRFDDLLMRCLINEYKIHHFAFFLLIYAFQLSHFSHGKIQMTVLVFSEYSREYFFLIHYLEFLIIAFFFPR